MAMLSAEGAHGVRVLSSRLTPFYRVTWLIPALISASSLVVGILSRDGGVLLVAGAMAIAAAVDFHYFARLKLISVAGDTLYASTFLRTVEVPISAIVDVEVPRGQYGRAHAHLRVPTPFGYELVFLPAGSGSGQKSPVIVELLERARAAS